MSTPICLYRETVELATLLGGLAQLARAPALQAGGQRFESVILHYSVEGRGLRAERLLVKSLNAQRRTLIKNEIFDILTHKTVSKDLNISQTE